MVSHRCASKNVNLFNGEIAIHFPGPAGINEPIVWVFPKLEVCLDCGSANFTVPEEQLNLLQENVGSPPNEGRHHAST